MALSLRVRFAPNMRMKLTGALTFRLPAGRRASKVISHCRRPQLMRRPLGSCASEWCQESGLQVRGLSGWRLNLNSTGVLPRVEAGRASSAQRLQVYGARFELYAA